MVGYITKFETLKSDQGNLTLWRVLRWGKVIAQGAHSDPKEARREAGEAIVTAQEGAGARTATKNAARASLRAYLNTRPYAVQGTTELLLNGTTKARLASDAIAAEESWWRRDGKAMPIPSQSERSGRGRAPAPAFDVALKLVDIFAVLGRLEVGEGDAILVKPGLRRWAEEMFGEEWLTPASSKKGAQHA